MEVSAFSECFLFFNFFVENRCPFLSLSVSLLFVGNVFYVCDSDCFLCFLLHLFVIFFFFGGEGVGLLHTLAGTAFFVGFNTFDVQVC